MHGLERPCPHVFMYSYTTYIHVHIQIHYVLIHSCTHAYIYLLTHIHVYTYISSDVITIPMNTAVDNDDNQEEQMNKVKITDLPDDIFRMIREFVSIDALLLLANRHFHAIKGRLYY